MWQSVAGSVSFRVLSAFIVTIWTITHQRASGLGYKAVETSKTVHIIHNMAFHGRVIAISGAGSGIGLGAAKHLALQGASLSLADLSLTEFTTTDTEYGSLWGNCLITKVDVRDSQAVDSWIKETIEHFRRLDGAVNCAGVCAFNFYICRMY